MTLVDRSGAPRGERYFAIYNPPVVNRQLGIRKSALNSARDVSLSFLAQGPADDRLRALAPRDRGAGHVPEGGARDEAGLGGRSSAATAAATCRSSGARSSAGCARARCSASSRRTRSSSGSTSAASTRRCSSATRAASPRPGSRPGAPGGAAGTSVAVLVANSTPLNQFIAKNPDYFFGSPVEQGRINPDNLQILVNHVKCAAFELPFVGDERFGKENLARDPEVPRGGEAAAPGGRALALDERQLPGRRGQPALGLLRQLRDPGRDARAADHRRGGLRLGAVDGPREGHLHPRGPHATSSRSTTTRSGACEVREAEVDYYTDAITYTKVRILERFAEEPRRERAGATTARCTSPRRWSASRRSSSTRTRTWARAS